MERKVLIKAAKELNRIMGLEPSINTEGDIVELKEGLSLACEMITPEDEISSKTKAVLKNLKEEVEEVKEEVKE